MTNAAQVNTTTRSKKTSIEGFFENISNPATITNERIIKRAIVCNTIFTGSGNGSDDFSEIILEVAPLSNSSGSLLEEAISIRNEGIRV